MNYQVGCKNNTTIHMPRMEVTLKKGLYLLPCERGSDGEDWVSIYALKLIQFLDKILNELYTG